MDHKLLLLRSEFWGTSSRQDGGKTLRGIGPHRDQKAEWVCSESENPGCGGGRGLAKTAGRCGEGADLHLGPGDSLEFAGR